MKNDETSRTVALGWHDDQRMADDYALVDEYLKMDKPYDCLLYTSPSPRDS